MKLKASYIIIFIIYGFIAGFFVALAVSAALAGIFWLFIFGDNPWPDWVYMLLTLLFFTAYAGSIIFGVLLGMKYGKRKEACRNPQAQQEKVKRRMLIAVICSIVFTSSLSVYARMGRKRSDRFKANQQETAHLLSYKKNIDHISLAQKGEGVDIAVNIPGPAEGRFRLEVELVSSSYVKAKLLDFTDEVDLRLKKQSFHFYIPFDQLSEHYREELLNYIPFFDRPFEIDEYIQVNAALQLIQHERFTQEKIDSAPWPENIESAVMRFDFLCFKETCEVVQKDPEELEE